MLLEQHQEPKMENNPDLVFLDTNFCNGTGFELLNKFQTVDFQVIFTASCEEYAMQAFKVHAADYLLKPVNLKALDLAMNRVHQTLCFSNKKQSKNNIQNKI